MTTVEEPKRPMTAYFLYIQANREAVQKELGVKEFGPVTKTLSSRWKTLKAPEMAKYTKMAEDAKATYDKELAAFVAAGGVKGSKRKEKKDDKEAKAAKKAKKAANAASGKPKKPAGGAYGCYMAHHRAEIHKSLPAGSKVTAISKVGGEQWKALSAKEKEKYEVEYQNKKKEYDEKLKAWKAEHGDDDNDGEGDDDDEDEAAEGATGGA
jgi:hypothetical protein